MVQVARIDGNIANFKLAFDELVVSNNVTRRALSSIEFAIIGRSLQVNSQNHDQLVQSRSMQV